MKDEAGFEHNMQSLRVLDVLEEKYPDFPGLNLCWETREGIIKHTTDYDSPVFKDYEPELSPTLESQVVNIADEIAYNSHDVDDGITSKILSLEGLKTTKIWKEIEKNIDAKKFEGLPLDMQKYNLTRALISVQITNLINTTIKNIRDKKIDSLEKVRQYRGMIVEFSDDMKALHRDLKSYLYNNFYKHYKVVRMEYKAEKIIQDLFEIYLKRGKTIDERGIENSILPPDVKKRMKDDTLKRVICDYIASMTDRSIMEEYKKLFDPYEKV
jgi:dGTPase